MFAPRVGADTFKRTVRRHWSLVERAHACCQHLDALVEMLGPSYVDVLGATNYADTALAFLERYTGPSLPASPGSSTRRRACPAGQARTFL